MKKRKRLKKVDMNLAGIGERLKLLRKTLNLTIREIAVTAGLSSSIISDFERGNKKPSSQYLWVLGNDYNADINYILTGEGDFFRHKEVVKEIDPSILEMVHLMTKLEVARYTMLAEFHDFKLRYRNIISELEEKQ